MKRGYISIVISLTAMLFLTACASIPEMEPEEEEMVTEYAASLLLKYDSENHSRLVPVDNYISAYDTAKRIHDDAEEKYYADLKAEEEQRKMEAKAQEELNNKASESDTVFIEDGEEQKEVSGTPVVDARSIADILGAKDFSIEYSDFEVVDSYPDGVEDVFFSMDATSGNQLLVVGFNVTNLSSQDNELDVFNVDPTFKLSVNGGKYSSVFKTFILEDDLSLFLGNFSANQTQRLVLVTEIPKGTSVDSLGLRVTVGSDSITKILK